MRQCLRPSLANYVVAAWHATVIRINDPPWRSPDPMFADTFIDAVMENMPTEEEVALEIDIEMDDLSARSRAAAAPRCCGRANGPADYFYLACVRADEQYCEGRRSCSKLDV